MDPSKEMWGDDDDCEATPRKYTPSVSATIAVPGKAKVNEIFGMLYSTLNGIQRLVHMAVDASDGLVSEYEAKVQLQQMERWVEQSTETMKEQATAIDNLKKMLDIYEKSVWVKTQELAEAHNQNGNNDIGSREAIINSLQEQLSEMEQRYDSSEVQRAEHCFRKLYADGTSQTEPLPNAVYEQETDEVDIPARRAKVNPRHPMFLKLKCLDCKMPMTSKRWLALPRATQRQLAFLQIEVDRFIKNKQKEVVELLPDTCLGCQDIKKVQECSLPLKESELKLSTARKKSEENVFSIDMSQIRSRASDTEDLQSGAMSQRSSVIIAPVQPTNILKRGIQKLRKRENTLSGDTALMVRLAVLNKLRERGAAVDVSISKEANQKLGLRVKKDLSIEGYDPGSLAEKMSDDLPIGHFIVSIDCNPVMKLGAAFSKLMSQQQLSITISETPFSQDPQSQLNNLLLGDAAVARSSISLTEPPQFPEFADEDQNDCDDHEEALVDPLSGHQQHEKQESDKVKQPPPPCNNSSKQIPNQTQDEVEEGTDPLRLSRSRQHSEKQESEKSKEKEEEEDASPFNEEGRRTPLSSEKNSCSYEASGSERQPSESSSIQNQPPPSLSAPSASIRSSLSSINVTPRLNSSDRPPAGGTPQKSIKDTASSWFNKLVKKPPSASSSPSNPSSNYVATKLHIDAFPD
eukprot:TRINITY_DN1215_c2_g1_i2.p1 TRINITY_DN1215_c2_g1~~TRINITY_DN1215_c2_g1_i2.p1  ORF type:complete len:690 (+),score=190.86 TRINITY_DN1215_c2_g1_i2:47-2116(+)